MGRVYFGDSLAVGVHSQDRGAHNLAVSGSGLWNNVTYPGGRRTTYEALVPQINRGDQVVVSIGTNDLDHITSDAQFNRYTARLTALVQQMRSEGASEIVFLHLSPTGRPAIDAYMDELNTFYRGLDTRFDDVRVVDTRGAAARHREPDHIHYTGAGYRDIRDAVNNGSSMARAAVVNNDPNLSEASQIQIANLQRTLVNKGYSLGDWPALNENYPHGADGVLGVTTMAVLSGALNIPIDRLRSMDYDDVAAAARRIPQHQPQRLAENDLPQTPITSFGLDRGARQV